MGRSTAAGTLADDMEFLLLWLDEIDDAVCALVQAVERLRLPFLEIGYAAACALLVDHFARLPDAWTHALASIAVVGVALWALGSMIRALPSAPLVPRAQPRPST